jgi:hypothetical protein
LYSWGYKNRAIVKKMLKISPIFIDRFECQPFIPMVFFDSRKDLACMQSPFFSQSFQVGRDVTPFSSHFNFLQDA